MQRRARRSAQPLGPSRACALCSVEISWLYRHLGRNRLGFRPTYGALANSVGTCAAIKLRRLRPWLNQPFRGIHRIIRRHLASDCGRGVAGSEK